MSSTTRKQLEKWVSGIEPTGRVLDIGGSQLPVIDRVKETDYISEYKIVDLEKPHVCKRDPDFVFDIQDIGEAMRVSGEEGEFDTIFCLEVMEYVCNPVATIFSISYFLKKRGKLYISFPFVYPHHNPIEDDCLRYTETGVRKLIKNAGLTIEKMEYRTAESDSILRAYSDEGMRASKEYPNHKVTGFLVTVTK